LALQVRHLGQSVSGLLDRTSHAQPPEPMKKVARMLRAHEDLLFYWFRAKGEISAGTVEGLNNKIRVVTRRSDGFRTYEPMEMALYHTLARLPEPESAHRFC
jgi:transposase